MPSVHLVGLGSTLKSICVIEISQNITKKNAFHIKDAIDYKDNWNWLIVTVLLN